MKSLLRHYITDTVTLYLVSLIVSGLIFENGIQTVLLAGVGLMVSSMVIRPAVNILILPLNLVTFGFFKWVSSVVALYLVTLVVPGFKIAGFNFPGLVSTWIDIPAINLSGFLAYIAFSFLISVIASTIFWIIK